MLLTHLAPFFHSLFSVSVNSACAQGTTGPHAPVITLSGSSKGQGWCVWGVRAANVCGQASARGEKRDSALIGVGGESVMAHSSLRRRAHGAHASSLQPWLSLETHTGHCTLTTHTGTLHPFHMLRTLLATAARRGRRPDRALVVGQLPAAEWGGRAGGGAAAGGLATPESPVSDERARRACVNAFFSSRERAPCPVIAPLSVTRPPDRPRIAAAPCTHQCVWRLVKRRPVLVRVVRYI